MSNKLKFDDASIPVSQENKHHSQIIDWYLLNLKKEIKFELNKYQK